MSGKPRRKKQETEEAYQERLVSWLSENREEPAETVENPSTSRKKPLAGRPRRKRSESDEAFESRLQAWRDSVEPAAPQDAPPDETAHTAPKKTLAEEPVPEGLEETANANQEAIEEIETITDELLSELEKTHRGSQTYADDHTGSKEGIVKMSDGVNLRQNEVTQRLITERKHMVYGYRRVLNLIKSEANGTIFLIYTPKYKKFLVAYSMGNREGEELQLIPLSGGTGVITASTIKALEGTSPISATVLRVLAELSKEIKPLRF